jgi:hypothetical protein
MDLNRALNIARFNGFNFLPGFEDVDNRFVVPNLQVDIRIVLSWNANLVDVELHVIGRSFFNAYNIHCRPTRRRSIFISPNNKHRRIGVQKFFSWLWAPRVLGMVTVFVSTTSQVRKAMPGTYTIAARIFSPAVQRFGKLALH